MWKLLRVGRVTSKVDIVSPVRYQILSTFVVILCSSLVAFKGLTNSLGSVDSVCSFKELMGKKCLKFDSSAECMNRILRILLESILHELKNIGSFTDCIIKTYQLEELWDPLQFVGFALFCLVSLPLLQHKFLLGGGHLWLKTDAKINSLFIATLGHSGPIHMLGHFGYIIHKYPHAILDIQRAVAEMPIAQPTIESLINDHS